MSNKEVYALMTTRCNLDCPHCDIHLRPENYNPEKFMDQLRKFDGSIVVFGGESLLYPERVEMLLDDEEISKKLSTVSTNLLLLDDKRIDLIKRIVGNGGFGTSWNPQRFSTEKQYKTWVNNLKIASDNDLTCTILITLTPDLFEMGVDKFFELAKEWDLPVTKVIKFEHLIAEGLDESYYSAADKWLCDIYTNWDKNNFQYMNLKNISWKDNFYFDCSGIYTLNPDGTMLHGCPNYKPMNIPDKCYSCERSSDCMPCMLASDCPYPKNFVELVKLKEGSNED